MSVDGEMLRMVMVLHDIRDYAHGYVPPAVRHQINRTLDAYQEPEGPVAPEASDLPSVLLTLASEAQTLAWRLAAGSDGTKLEPGDVLLATIASRCRYAIAAAH